MKNNNIDNIVNYQDFLYKNRIILIDKEFEHESCSNWIQQILALDIDSDKRIIIIINSTGGDVNAALGLIDVVRNCRSEIYTVCTGIAASCAANLLVAGDKRFATENSTIMIHQIFTSIENIKSGDIVNEAKEIIRLQEIFTDLYVEKTGLSRAKIKNLHKGDNYLNPSKAKKLNIIDEIGWNIHDWLRK